MRGVRLNTACLTAILVAIGLVNGTSAAPLEPGAPLVDAAYQVDQAPPAPTTAFTPGDCPVAIGLPDGAADAVCGTVSVPQLHADPAGRELSLGAIRIPAVGGERASEPVVVLAGGADGSALDIAPRAAELLAAFPGRDLLLMDHRGDRYSTPVLRCDEDDPVRLAEVSDGLGGTAPIDAHLAAFEACAQRLRDAGYDLAAFDADEAARDIADVVAALGYDAGFDLVAIGDGTRAAVAALRAGTPGLRSATLDSLVAPQQSATAVLARDAWALIEHLSEACAEDEPCSTLLDDLEGGVVDAAAQLDIEPAVVPVDDAGTPRDVMITGSALVEAIVDRFALAPGEIDAIPAFIASATTVGDPTPIATQLLAQARDTSRSDLLAWTLRCSQDLAGATDDHFEGVPDAFSMLSGRLGDRHAVVETCAALGVEDAGGAVHDPW